MWSWLTNWFGLSPSSSSSQASSQASSSSNIIKHESCKLCGDEFDDEEKEKKEVNKDEKNRVYAYMHSGSALNRRELGRASWAYLHTLANYYPENPSLQHQKEMVELIWLFMKYYPCGYCSDMTIQEMYRNPPRVKNRMEFSSWMCEIHNEVNMRLGYPLFDCNTNNISKRWRI